jgi:hypothetical protein
LDFLLLNLPAGEAGFVFISDFEIRDSGFGFLPTAYCQLPTFPEGLFPFSK